MPEFHRTCIAASLFVLCLTGCGSEPQQPSAAVSEPVSVAVTSYPLLVMTEQMVGAAADVELVVRGETTSPAWKPTSNAVQAMQQATRILISGGDYEPWLQRVTVPRSRLIDTAEGYYDQFIRIPDAVIHQHGPDGSHSHPGVVWATWLDPQLAISQAERTRDVLLNLLPDDVAHIRQAADVLVDELRHLDSRLDEMAASTSESEITVLGDAPVYQYLIRRLGWDLKYVHLPNRGPLTDAERASLTKAIEENQPSMVWIQSTLANELALLQGDTQLPLVFIDLCETPDAERTLTERLGENLKRIEAAL